MRHEETPLSIGLVILIVLIGIFVESCWSGSVADSDIHSHKYIVVAGKYYLTEDIEYIDDEDIEDIEDLDDFEYESEES